MKMNLEPSELLELMASDTQAQEPHIPGFRFIREINFNAEVVDPDLADGEICFEVGGDIGSTYINTWVYPCIISYQPGNQYLIFRRQ